MASLTDLPELIGFFSYSRDDDDDSHGTLSALRDRIQRELRGQLGRKVRLWQDKEAIAPGKLWEGEIKAAIEQSAFFIPIVTPTAVNSAFCKHEFDAFLARERALGRDDLVFPIYYIRVPALEHDAEWRSDPVLLIVGQRQWTDWRELRLLDVQDTRVREAIAQFCAKVADTLQRCVASPEEKHRQAETDREEAERRQQAADAKRRSEQDEGKDAKRTAPSSTAIGPVDAFGFNRLQRVLLGLGGGAAVAVLAAFMGASAAWLMVYIGVAVIGIWVWLWLRHRSRN